jgi:carboxylesterase
VGTLLIHGYTGSAAETRPMGEFPAGRGLTIRCPLLPGHGTTPEDLTRIRWQSWASEVETALEALYRRCDEVFVGGLSLGSLLSLWLGVKHPEIAGLIPISPPSRLNNRLFGLVPALRHVMRYNPLQDATGDLVDPAGVERMWSYDELPLWGAGEVHALQQRVRGVLPQIRQPILIFQGRHDTALAPDSAQILYDGVSSEDKQLIWLESSGHNVLVDAERQAVWQRSFEWIAGRSQIEPVDVGDRE